MGWSEVDEAFARLAEACHAGKPLAEPWRPYSDAVRECNESAPPFHLWTLLELVERIRGDRTPSSVRILEHGSGSGAAVLYLLALGYTGIFGVDVGGRCEDWNRLTREQFGIEEKRFFRYDGLRIPIEDAKIDLVYSQQVLEHVRPNVLEAYYREEGRILRTGGMAYHEVPHRLVPFESHAQTWFVHFLPKVPRRILYRFLGKDAEVLENAVFLRWPGFHRRMARRHIGPVEDITLARLSRPVDPAYYDGPVGLRNLIRRAVTTPLIGLLAGAVFRNLVMIETIAVKPTDPTPTSP